MLGTIKKIMDKWFGFITPEDGGKDLFFHFSSLEGGADQFNELKEGQEVEFDVVNGKKPWEKQASNVKLV